MTILLQKNTLVSCVLYALLGMTTVMVTEIFPLWALLPPEHGGLGSTSSSIGLLMMIGAPFQLVAQLAVYPRLVKRIGLLRTFRRSALWVAAFVFFTPFVGALSVWGVQHASAASANAAPSSTMATIAASSATATLNDTAPSPTAPLWTTTLAWWLAAVCWTSLSAVVSGALSFRAVCDRRVPTTPTTLRSGENVFRFELDASLSSRARAATRFDFSHRALRRPG